MKINANICCDEVVYRTSRDSGVCKANRVPDGAMVIAVGPSRITLLAQLAACSAAAAHFIRESK